MWNKQRSLVASLIMTGALLVLIAAAIVLLPTLVRAYAQMTGVAYESFKWLVVALYVSALPGIVCCVSLMRLLLNIRRGEVFQTKNATILRVLSWCCFFVGAEYFVFGVRWYITLVLLSFAALFFGLILRVIKNVFEKAILLQEENDYTV